MKIIAKQIAFIGPEIMKGLDIVPKAKKKKVSKTAEAHKEQV